MTEREELRALFQRLGVEVAGNDQYTIRAADSVFRFDIAGRFRGLHTGSGYQPRLVPAPHHSPSEPPDPQRHEPPGVPCPDPGFPAPMPDKEPVIDDIVEIKRGERWFRHTVVRTSERVGHRCFWVDHPDRMGAIPYFGHDQGILWRWPVTVAGPALRLMVAFPAAIQREEAQQQLLAMAQKFGPVEADWNGVKMFAFPEDTLEMLRVRWGG